MGRHAAGESFLRAFIKYGPESEFSAITRSREHAAPFVGAVRSVKPDAKIRVIDEYKLGEVDPPEAVFYPGPGLSRPSFQRAKYGASAWSLCGIAHTTSSDLAMDSLTQILVSPVESWDAVICPSEAVKSNIVNVLDAQKEFLSKKLSANNFLYPQLPVIPLGVHGEDFSYTAEDSLGARRELEIEDDEVVVGYMGRLSFHAKAHPLSMYRALEKASKQSGKKVTLIECGWHGNNAIRDAFTEAQVSESPSVRSIVLDGRDEKSRSLMWASTDIFCSLSDNIQETFGITPLEAMAAGIPVVVSDWNGYKESVQNGIEGFKIPTTMPDVGHGGELARNFGMGKDHYDLYCGQVCMFVAVDQSATVEAFTKLIESPELRAQMGESGKKRIESQYDWRVIIPRYEDLWAELQSIRETNGGKPVTSKVPWPARLDPFSSFSHYSSNTLKEDSLIALVDSDVGSALDRVKAYKKLGVLNFAVEVFPTDPEVEKILRAALGQESLAKGLVESIEPDRQEFCMRALAWLLKVDILRLIQ